MDTPADFLIRQCPYCRCRRTRRHYVVNGETVRYCQNCNLIFREKHESEENIANYYRNNFYEDWGDDQEGRLRDTIYLDALRFLEAKISKGLLLDIGASNGRLLSIARGRGWEVEGQEISKDSCRLAKEKYDLDLISDDLKDMEWKADHFDAITMINVLDHLPDPWWVLEKSFGALKQGGAVYIRVPNGYLHSCLYRITGGLPITTLEEKIRKFLVIHLYHLTSRFFNRVLKEKGFRSIIIRGANVSKMSFNPNFTKEEALGMYMLKKYIPLLSNLIDKLTLGNLIISPSINVFASKY